MTINWTVAVGEETTSAMYEPAASGTDVALFVCAHGAGGNMLDRGMTATATALRENGLGVVRFNFLYKEKKSGRPDPMPRLIATTRAVIAHAVRELAPARLIIGGRSMGGRAASMLAAEAGESGVSVGESGGALPAMGLLLLAYPLHPAGQPAKLRDAHLASIRMPVLCFNGTRDALCTRDLMERVLADRARSGVRPPGQWNMQWVEGADHMFHVLKSSSTTDAAVMAQIGRTAGEWAAKL